MSDERAKFDKWDCANFWAATPWEAWQARAGLEASALDEGLRAELAALALFHEKQAIHFRPFGDANVLTVFHEKAAKTIRKVTYGR